MQIRGTQGTSIWQWTTVQQHTFQRILWTTRNQEPLFLTLPPTGQWPGRGSKPILIEDHQDSAWRGKGSMAGWVTGCERPRPRPPFIGMLGQTHVNGWSRVVASQNGGSTSYVFALRLGILQWSRHLFNYWKIKKTIIERFFILLIWNWIHIDHRKITWLWS